MAFVDLPADAQIDPAPQPQPGTPSPVQPETQPGARGPVPIVPESGAAVSGASVTVGQPNAPPAIAGQPQTGAWPSQQPGAGTAASAPQFTDLPHGAPLDPAAPAPDKVDNWETRNFNFAGMRKPGIYASPTQGGFQSYATPEQGVAAIANQLKRYYEGKTTGKPLTTLNDIISTWAPPSTAQNPHENDTNLLIRRGVGWLYGVDAASLSPEDIKKLAGQPIDLNDQKTMAKMIEVMIRNEQGGKLPLSPDVISRVAGAPGQYLAPPTLAASGWNIAPNAIASEQARGDTSVVYMAPDEFLNLGKGTSDIKADDYRNLKQKLANTPIESIPSAEVAADGQTLKVNTVDGRSRALAALDAGVDLIPVALHGIERAQSYRYIQGMKGQVVPYDFQTVPTVQVATGASEFLHGLTNPAVGLAQLRANYGVDSGVMPAPTSGGAPGSLRQRMFEAAQAPRPSAAEVNAAVTARETAYQQSRANAGRTGFSVPEFAGEVIGGAPLVATGAGTGGVISTLLRAGTAGVLGGLSAPVTGGDYGRQKLQQAVIGGALGAGVGAIAGTIGNAISARNIPAPVRRMADLGIRPTVGQMAGPVAARAESRLSSIPVLSDLMGAGLRRQMRDFNRIVYDKILGMVGLKSSGKAIGTEGVREVQSKLDDAFDKLKAQINFTLDSQFVNEVQQVFRQTPLTPDRQNQLSRLMQNVIMPRVADKSYNFTPIDGETFKLLESRLSHDARMFQSPMADADQRLLGEAVDGINGALRDALERNNAMVWATVGGRRVNVREELKALNTAWAALKRLQVAASNRPTSGGVFTPGDLLSAEKRLSGFPVFSRGEGLLQSIAEDAQKTMGNAYPDSGTAGRLLTSAVVGGGGLVNPALIAKAGLLALPYTSPAMAVLRGAARTPGPIRNVLGQVPIAAGRIAAPGLGLAASSRPSR